MEITVLGKDVFKNEISLAALSTFPFATAPVNSRAGNPFWTWTPWVKITSVLVGDSWPDSRTLVLSFWVLLLATCFSVYVSFLPSMFIKDLTAALYASGYASTTAIDSSSIPILLPATPYG